MSSLCIQPTIPAMTPAEIGKVARLESEMMRMEQVPIKTTHHFHAGMYARTICIPAGVMITGVKIKRETVLIVSGHTTVYIGERAIEIRGYEVIPASAGRKQVFLAHADTDLTMLFATEATTVEQAEEEFTDETELLMSRKCSGNSVVLKGE